MEPQLVSSLSRCRSGRQHRAGIALVIALIVLALMTVMVVTMLLTISSENVTSKSQASSASAKRLSDVAVQLVMAQIRDATQDQTTASNPTASPGNPYCLWASQPGMVRTYDSTGKPNNAFKLYSDSNMKVASSAYNPATDLAGWGDWASQPALYTDLNAPSQGAYPIFDPTLADKGISMASPGYAPSAASKRVVDGFYIDTSAAPLTAPSNTTNTQAAMPVRWLYVLKDGEVVPPDASSTGTQVTVANSAKVPPGSTYTVNGVTFTNEIIGRIAFWTDDETCKLNVNTASEGTYWDTPMFCEGQDVAYGIYQPATYEYSRYPGHPATTCLSPALWSFLGLPDPLSSPAATYTSDSGYSFGPNGLGTPPPPGPSASLSLAGASTAFPTLLGTAAAPGLVPRNLWGGSKAGSINTLTSGNYTGLTSSNIRHDRLYTNIDEFLFGPNYNSTTRAYNPASISATKLAQLRFVLTADSRAPDTNPFGLPKVSIWPSPSKTAPANPANAAWTAGANPSVEEQLLAFCSTLQNDAYYFDRHDPTSTTADFSARNQLVYNYIRNLMDKAVPGFGASFTAGKWTPLQADIILTEIYDYIRSCLNLVDSSNNTGASAYTFPYSYTNPPAQTSGSTSSTLNYGTGQVVPISITNPDGNKTKGLGRFPTLRAATLMFIARAANQPPLIVDANSRPVIYDSSIKTPPGTGNPTAYVSGGLLTQAGLQLVLGLIPNNSAFAQTNNLHPWTNAPPNYVGLMTYQGYPVLAYNSTAFLNGTLSDAPNLYPIFNLTSSSTLPTYTYPTLSGTKFYETYVGATPVKATIIISGTKYYYYKAVISTLDGAGSYAAGTIANAPGGSGGKTHAGMPFLTLQRDSGNGAPKALGAQTLEGAFDIVNPSYVDTTVNPLANMTPGTNSIEAILLPELQNPAPGNVPYSPNFSLLINNLGNFTANGTSLGFQNNQTETIQVGANGSSPGNYNGFFSNISYSPTVSNRYLTVNGSYGGKGNSNLSPFPFYSKPTQLTGGAPTFAFAGGNLDIQFKTASSQLVQDITVNFPNATFPMPKLTPWWSAGQWLDYPPQIDTELVPPWMNTFNLNDAKLGVASASNPSGFKLSRIAGSAAAALRAQYRFILPEMNQTGMYTQSCDTLESVEAKYGDIRLIAALPVVPATFFVPNPLYGDSNAYSVIVNTNPPAGPSVPFTTYMRAAHSMYLNDCPQLGTQLNFLMESQPAINNYSYIADSGTALCVTGGPGTGSNPTTASSVSYPSTYITSTAISNMMPIKFAQGDNPVASTTASGAGYNGTGTYATFPFTTPSMDFNSPTFQAIWQSGGDFDNGEGLYADGPFIGKVDEGDGQNNYYSNTINAQFGLTGASLFSPNRQAPSPIIFGSLPVGFGQTSTLTAPSPNMLNNSWQTLMFCPNPNAITSASRNSRTSANGIPEPNSLPTPGQLPDYALLDFFYMPIVEPYAISGSYATAGKVNMNYQIVPYTYINRDTALRGVLKSVMLTAVDDQWIVDYKYRGTNSDNPSSYNRGITNGTTPGGIPPKTNWSSFGNNTNWQTFRYNINADETLKQFQQRFANLDIFRTPSEICSLWLYPIVPTNTPIGGGLGAQAAEPLWDAQAVSIKSWWYDKPGITRKGLTGMNMRERPYNDIYPRLTTRSNTFTVHYRVQLLKKSSTTPVATWMEPSATGTTSGQDTILGEYRGSSLIERYIDPNDTTLGDFTGSNLTHNLDYYYKFRIDSSREFAP